MEIDYVPHNPQANNQLASKVMHKVHGKEIGKIRRRSRGGRDRGRKQILDKRQWNGAKGRETQERRLGRGRVDTRVNA